jgi:hypothetical protein
MACFVPLGFPAIYDVVGPSRKAVTRLVLHGLTGVELASGFYFIATH